MNHRILILFIVFTLSSFSLSAGRFNPYGTDWALGVNFGTTCFYGDINIHNGPISATPFLGYYYENARLMGGISLEKWFGPYVGVIGNIQYGSVQGTKETSTTWFEANIFEYNLAAMANLTNILFGPDGRRKHFFYFSAGIGMSESKSWRYSTKTDKLITSNGLDKSMTESMGVLALGVKYFIGNNLTLSFETSANTINSDKLDVKANENFSVIAKTEGYTYIKIGMQYNFGNRGRYSSIRYRHKSRYNGGRGGLIQYDSRKFYKNKKKSFRKRKRKFKFGKG